ncbi:MAG: hypothetical protein ACI8UX_001982, partial [Psychromonas sp.]
MDYFMAVYSAYTKPNLLEPKRFIIFSEKYRFL